MGKEFISHCYPNATVFKLKNSRVVVEDLNENGIGICFKIFCSKEEAILPSSLHRVVRERVKITSMRISENAAIALYNALQRQLSIRKTKKAWRRMGIYIRQPEPKLNKD